MGAEGRDVTADGLVLCGKRGEATRSSNFRRRIWTPAVAEAQLSPLTPHDLRHSAVSLWIAAGLTPKEVSVRAGHASVSFTFDQYGHLFPSQDEKQADKLDTLLAAWYEVEHPTQVALEPVPDDPPIPAAAVEQQPVARTTNPAMEEFMRRLDASSRRR